MQKQKYGFPENKGKRELLGYTRYLHKSATVSPEPVFHVSRDPICVSTSGVTQLHYA